MDKEWILQIKEIRKTFSNSTWVPLRASFNNENGNIKTIGYQRTYFGCGSVAFPKKNKKVAEKLGWSNLGLINSPLPYAYADGSYSSIEQYCYEDNKPIGINLVFEHPQPVAGARKWILNPDLIVALRLIQEKDTWVRPEEDFTVVIREYLDKDGEHNKIEIKREFLIDYLAARNLSLRISYYRQHVENVANLEDSEYTGLIEEERERDGGRFRLSIRSLNEVFGGNVAVFKSWRTDIDEEEDAPVMGPENSENVTSEMKQMHLRGYHGVRIEGEFWRDEWIEHQGRSIRVRGDIDPDTPNFIVETDGTRMASKDLDDDNIGRWLWFTPNVVRELLCHRGFLLKWYTAMTGGICSTSGQKTHFGINSSDLITVYAYDIARLAPWEQRIWAAHNVAPDGKVSNELFASQVNATPANTFAAEELLFKNMRSLGENFASYFESNLYLHDIDDIQLMQKISRFVSKDQSSLLSLAKELIRVFSDRLNSVALKTLSKHDGKENLGSNKLLQALLGQHVGSDTARQIFGVIAGVYDMRVGDAHPTSSKIEDALQLAQIDSSRSLLSQGEQLIFNYGRAISKINELLFTV